MNNLGDIGCCHSKLFHSQVWPFISNIYFVHSACNVSVFGCTVWLYSLAVQLAVQSV